MAKDIGVNIKFKSQVHPVERKTIMDTNNQLLQDYQKRRRKNFTQKIWKRDFVDQALSINNPNLTRPKRELLGNYLPLQSSCKTLPAGNSTANSEIGLLGGIQGFESIAETPNIGQKKGAKKAAQLFQIFGGAKSSKILDSIVKTSQKGLLGQAMGIVQKRHEDSENIPVEKRDSVHETVEKANSVYVIDLTTRLINEEIERLQKMEVEKKAALKAIEKAKEAEFIRFRENFERVKKVTEQTVEQSNEVAKKKTALIREIKAKSQIQGILKHDTKKLEDLASYYTELKHFLTVVSPDFFKEKKTKDM